MSNEVDLSEKILVDDMHAHPNILFVMARKDSFESIRELGDPVVDVIPNPNFRLESYVLLSALSLDLQNKIRGELISVAFDFKRLPVK